MKFIPGPWKVHRSGVTVITDSDPEKPVALVYLAHPSPEGPTEEQKERARATATLIAAAPQMLAALKLVGDFLGTFSSGSGQPVFEAESMSSVTTMVNAVKDAIEAALVEK